MSAVRIILGGDFVMSLSDLAAIGSLVSGLAVLVSLVYLSLQVRQTERNQRALMNQGVVTRTVELIMLNNEPNLNAIHTRVYAGETTFTAQEINLLRNTVRARLTNVQDAYLQHRSGLTDQITFDNALGGARSMLTQPVYRAIWISHRTTYAPEWMAYVDKLIESTPLSKPVDSVTRFNADLAEVMR
jgi:hypothetical protein